MVTKKKRVKKRPGRKKLDKNLKIDFDNMPIISEAAAKRLQENKIAVIEIDGKKLTLKPLQEAFCREYTLSGNAREAYGKVYGVKKYSDVLAFNMLRKPQIRVRIAQLLQASGFDDLNVMSQHLKLINQDQSVNAKAKAIEMYYKLKGLNAPDKKEITKTVITEERKKYIDALIEIVE
jgi:hypothetical protein